MTNNAPTGEYLLSLLMELLAEQEGVTITYRICSEDGESVRRTTGEYLQNNRAAGRITAARHSRSQ